MSLFASIPFVERDTEIQHCSQRVSMLQSILSSLESLYPVVPVSGEMETSVPLGCVAVMPTRRDVIAVTCSTQADCRVGDIYLYGADGWMTPPLTHPSQQDGIYCLRWLPMADVLLVGTSSGVALWSLCSLFEKETDKSWVSILRHPRGRPITDIQVCPTGRLFAAISKADNDVLIFDAYTKACTSLYCIRGSTCAQLTWSPSGKFILVGTHTGEMVMWDTDSWERNDANIYEVGSCISKMSWLTLNTCLVVPARSLHIYTYSTCGGMAAASSTGGGVSSLEGRDGSAIQNYPVVMSPIPVVLDAAPFEAVLDSRSIPWKSVHISDLKTELSTGLVAVTVECTLEDRPECLTLPVVVVYMASLGPQLTMTAIRTVSFDQFSVADLDIFKQQPIGLEFRAPKSASSRKISSYALNTPGNNSRGRSGGVGGSNALTGRNASSPTLAIMWSAGAISCEECVI